MSTSNVVINLLGPRWNIKNYDEFEFINIEVPRSLAWAAKENGILRFVHFSSCGVSKDSKSYDL